MRGLMQAATTDNVQPLALHACEQLGTTLPILNTTTRIKIEKLAGRKHSQPLSFVKTQVGFRAGDSADMLSKNGWWTELLVPGGNTRILGTRYASGGTTGEFSAAAYKERATFADVAPTP